MLLSHQVVSIPQIGAHLEEHTVLHPLFRLILSIRDGVIMDDGLLGGALPSPRKSARSVLLVSLAGVLEVRAEGKVHILREGACLITRRDRLHSFRDDWRSLKLIMDWEPGAFGEEIGDSASMILLHSKELDGLRGAIRPILCNKRPDPEVAGGIGKIVGILRAAGIPLHIPEAGALLQGADRTMEGMVQAVDQALSHLHRNPMLSDLQRHLGHSVRKVHADLQRFLEVYGYNSGSWRELRNSVRLMTGMALMSRKEARTEEVAGMLGFSSPTAFCRNFAAAGLPSPGEIRRQLLRSSA